MAEGDDGGAAGALAISGFATPGNVVTERATRLTSPADWTPIQTNAVSGNYSIPVPMGTGSYDAYGWPCGMQVFRPGT